MGGPDFKRVSDRLRSTTKQDPTLSDEVYKRLYESSSDNVYHDEDTKATELLTATTDYLHSGQTDI